MTDLQNSCSAVILAGGRARRMGRDKRFMPIKRRPLLESHVSELSSRFAEVIISANDPERLDYLGVPVYPDEWAEGGPMTGLVTALRHIQQDVAFVLAVDIPEIDIELMERMSALVRATDAVVPRHADGNLEPLFGFYRKPALDWLEESLRQGGYALHSKLLEQNCTFVDLPEGYHLPNLNDPDDYQQYVTRKATTS